MREKYIQKIQSLIKNMDEETLKKLYTIVVCINKGEK